MFIGKLKTLVCKDLFKLDVVMRKGGADIALPKFVKWNTDTRDGKARLFVSGEQAFLL